MYFNPIAVPFAVTGVIMLISAYKIWGFRSVPGTRYFSLLAACCAIYSFFYALEISSSDLELILFWIKAEYIGIAFIPSLIILFILSYTGMIERLPKIITPFLFLFSLSTLIIFYTNPHHCLFYQEISLNVDGPFPIIDFTRGPWYWLHTLDIGFGILASNFLLMQMWVGTNKAYRQQITHILLSSLIPWFGFLLYQFRPIGWNVDINPLFLSLSAVIIFWSLSKHGLFQLLPVARTRLFEELPDGVLVIDSDMRIVDMNEAAKSILEINQPEIGMKAVEALSIWPKLAKMIKPASKGFHIELPREKDDKTMWYKINFMPLEDIGVAPFGQVLIFRDITDGKIFEEKLYNLTITDELTGLFNRRYFMQILDKELSRAKRYGQVFALIMIDLDNFKDINDSFGHNAGDLILKELSSILKTRLRQVDTAARLGGEEFGLIIPETELEDAYTLAESLREIIAGNPVVYESKEIAYTISLGVTTYRQGINEVEELLKAADKALYRAKDEGRNRTVRN